MVLAGPQLVQGPRRFARPGFFGVVDIGAFENREGAWYSVGCGVNAPGSLQVVSGTPALGGSFTVAVNDALGNISSGSTAALMLSSGLANGSCGIVLPGFGMNPANQGAWLLGSTIVAFTAGWTNPQTPANFAISVPNDVRLYGLSLYLQGALIEPGHIGLTDGLRALVGD